MLVHLFDMLTKQTHSYSRYGRNVQSIALKKIEKHQCAMKQLVLLNFSSTDQCRDKNMIELPEK